MRFTEENTIEYGIKQDYVSNHGLTTGHRFNLSSARWIKTQDYISIHAANVRN